MRRIVIVLTFLGLLVFASASSAGVGGGDMTFSPKNAKPVFFSHIVHVNVKSYKCSACHYHVFQMAKDTYKMDMAKINKGEFCGICHNGDRSFDVKDKKSCGKCHK